MRLIPNTKAWRNAVPDPNKRPDAWVAGYRARLAWRRGWLPAACPYLLSQELERDAWWRGWQAAGRAEGRRLARGAEAAREEIVA